MTAFRFRLGAAFVSTLLLAAPALAQTAAPAAPQAAPLPALSASHQALAVEVLRLSGMSRSIDVIVPQMVDRARQLFTQTRPELAADLDKSIQALKPDFEAQNAEAIRIAGAAFGHKLTEAELTDLKTFFSSASGRKFVSQQPFILEEMFGNLDIFTRGLSQTVVDKLREEMKKKGHSL